MQLNPFEAVFRAKLGWVVSQRELDGRPQSLKYVIGLSPLKFLVNAS